LGYGSPDTAHRPGFSLRRVLQSLGSLAGAVGLLVASAIWAILFVVILEVMNKASLFAS
jgi:hypothetical protein